MIFFAKRSCFFVFLQKSPQKKYRNPTLNKDDSNEKIWDLANRQGIRTTESHMPQGCANGG